MRKLKSGIKDKREGRGRREGIYVMKEKTEGKLGRREGIWNKRLDGIKGRGC